MCTPHQPPPPGATTLCLGLGLGLGLARFRSMGPMAWTSFHFISLHRTPVELMYIYRVHTVSTITRTHRFTAIRSSARPACTQHITSQSQHITSQHINIIPHSQPITSQHIISQHSTSHHTTSQHITSHHSTSHTRQIYSPDNRPTSKRPIHQNHRINSIQSINQPLNK